jgi:heme-degrading monooxygenase HmoA
MLRRERTVVFRESQWRDEMSAVTVINSFEVPAGREGEFLALWKQVNAYMQRKPGYRGNRLHRAITPDAPFQFVHVAQWASMAHFQGAHDTGFRELVDQPVWSAFLPHRVLFEVVHESKADSGASE